jgi:hypothetical protein
MEVLRLAAIQGGSELAHERAGTSSINGDRLDAFASKPAPTGDCRWMEVLRLAAIQGGSRLAHEEAGTFGINGD